MNKLAVIFLGLAIVFAVLMFLLPTQPWLWGAVLLAALLVSWKMKKLPRKEKEFD
ncbi:hypothetical protein [Pelagibaculum spongiae]|uniref:hypothetical protein n=1 Tax=Pelagibaculum spongiae TaxID=2080658 RepID=UPI0013149179|nr:hypothetical protein [Pelagibaculum spongiae]